MFFSYDEALNYLEQHNVSSLGLQNIIALLKYLGNPEDKMRFVHIAGTNGKGSVLSYISSVLTESGYNTGRYSSPFVFDECEIMSVNGNDITRDEFTEGMSVIKEAVDRMEKDGLCAPTRFEMETALAYWWFLKKNVDIAVIETGLGGRLDATNVVKNTLVAVITSISYDHMAILGSTLREIAGEKAGIIKSGSSVVSTYQSDEVREVIEKRARELGIETVFAGRGQFITGDIESQTISYKGRDFKTKLIGDYQLQNLPLAVEVLRALKRKGYNKINDVSVDKGLMGATWRARCEIIGNNPLFVIDGAHNDSASIMLADTIKKYFGDRRKIFVMGIFKDKDYRRVVENTVYLADEVITFDWDNPRHLSGAELKSIIEEYMTNVHYEKNAERAVTRAISDADDNSVIVAFGSLSHLREISEVYKEKTNG